MTRSDRAGMARDTVAAVERGGYPSPAGGWVDLGPAVAACLEGTTFYPAGGLNRARRDALAADPRPDAGPVEVTGESTLEAAARLRAEGCERVAALNFASARHPGGGFLTGAHAQEESLARASAVYASQLTAPDFYRTHQGGSLLYTDAVIVSPACPVFRDDAGGWLPEPDPVTFLTCAAPNAGAAARNTPAEVDRIPGVLHQRCEVVLAAAHAHGCDGLVLGAWGCGVFRNDPDAVAGAFAGHLRGVWAGRFRRVRFAVLDPHGETLAAFRRAFPAGG